MLLLKIRPETVTAFLVAQHGDCLKVGNDKIKAPCVRLCVCMEPYLK